MVPPGSHLSSKVHFIIARILVALGLIRWGRQTWWELFQAGETGAHMKHVYLLTHSETPLSVHHPNWYLPNPIFREHRRSP